MKFLPILLGAVLGNLIFAYFHPPENLEGWAGRGIGALIGATGCWTFCRLFLRPKKSKSVNPVHHCYWRGCTRESVVVFGTRFNFCEQHGDIRLWDVAKKGAGVTAIAAWKGWKLVGFATAPVPDIFGTAPSPDITQQSKFKAGDWVRATGKESGIEYLGEVVASNRPYWVGVCKEEFLIKLDGIPHAQCPCLYKIEPALPRKGEWWKDESCKTPHHHSSMESCPFVASNDWEHSVNAERVRCGCLRPVNFGRGEQSPDPTSSMDSTAPNATGSLGTANADHKPGDWVRLNFPASVNHGKLALVKYLSKSTPLPRVWVIFRKDQVLYSGWRPEDLEPALPREGEWWKWTSSICEHSKAVAVNLLPFSIQESCSPNMGACVKKGCCVPVNFGKGNG